MTFGKEMYKYQKGNDHKRYETYSSVISKVYFSLIFLIGFNIEVCWLFDNCSFLFFFFIFMVFWVFLIHKEIESFFEYLVNFSKYFIWSWYYLCGCGGLLSLSLLFKICFTWIMCVYVSICGYVYVWVQCPQKSKLGCSSFWNYHHRWLLTICRFWELNLRPLERLCVLLTAEPLLHAPRNSFEK